jgi:2-oxoglutarate ferredoxin oxidoreductase subunit beta
MQAAIRHQGTALLDIVSPCVTFNNDESSTKSYPYGKEHEIPLHEIQVLAPDYVTEKEEILIADYPEDEIIPVEMHDGTMIRLKKLGRDHDPRSRMQAISVLEEAQREQLFLTGLIYYEEPRITLAESENIVEEPIVSLMDQQLRPSKAALDEVMNRFM